MIEPAEPLSSNKVYSSGDPTPKLIADQSDRNLLKLDKSPYVNAALASALRRKLRMHPKTFEVTPICRGFFLHAIYSQLVN